MSDPVKVEHAEIAQIFVLPSLEEAAEFSAHEIANIVKTHSNPRITFATGNTQIKVYEHLVSLTRQGYVDLRSIKAFQLDEYYPCSSSEPYSFVGYLYKHIFNPLGMPEENIFTIDGEAKDAVLEVQRYEKLVAEQPMDLTILGIGPGVHMAFCEAGTPFDSRTSLIDLSRETIKRDKLERKQKSPSQAITQGIADILSSNKIIMNAFDAQHGGWIKEVLFKPVSPDRPASALRNVGDKVTIILDKDAANVAFS